MFRKVTKFELYCNVKLPDNRISFISTLIDLTAITEMKFIGILIVQAQSTVVNNLTVLLKQACNLTSLKMNCGYSSRGSKLTGQIIYEMVPSHVKHLTVAIKNLSEAKISLMHLQNLSSAMFYCYSTESFSRPFIEWLEQDRKGSSHNASADWVCIWFGNNSIQQPMANVGYKRIKLTNERHE